MELDLRDPEVRTRLRDQIKTWSDQGDMLRALVFSRILADYEALLAENARLQAGWTDEVERLGGTVVRLRVALAATREELARWGWGDLHYGSQRQEASVVAALAVADATLSLDGAAEAEA